MRRVAPRAAHGRDRGHHGHARAGEIGGALHDEPQRVGREVCPRRARRVEVRLGVSLQTLAAVREALLGVSFQRRRHDDDDDDDSVARPPPRRGLRGVRARPDVGAGVVHAVREVRDRGGAGGRDGAAVHRAGGGTGRAHTPTDDEGFVVAVEKRRRERLTTTAARLETARRGRPGHTRARIAGGMAGHAVTPATTPRGLAPALRSVAREGQRSRARASPRRASASAQATSSSSSPGLREAKRALLEACEGTFRGSAASASERAAVEEAQVALEGFTYSSGADPDLDLEALAGRWRLRWTNANDVLSVLRLARDSLGAVQVGDIFQTFDARGSLTNEIRLGLAFLTQSAARDTEGGLALKVGARYERVDGRDGDRRDATNDENDDDDANEKNRRRRDARSRSSSRRLGSRSFASRTSSSSSSRPRFCRAARRTTARCWRCGKRSCCSICPAPSPSARRRLRQPETKKKRARPWARITSRTWTRTRSSGARTAAGGRSSSTESRDV